MRQWLLRVTDWRIVETHHVRMFWEDRFSHWQTHLLYEKNGRFKTVKIKGRWNIYPDKETA